jgi:glucose-1-phosphate thymidylyltransferase
VHAIVMAAGEGRRLRPLTARWAKPVLPIDGQPVLAALLREFARAGIERVTVVTGHLADQVEALVGDGTAFGVQASFARQPRADGSADAVRRALGAGAEVPTILSAADTRYEPGAVVRFLEAFAAARAAGAIGARRGLLPSAAKPGLRIENGRVVRVVDLDPSLPLTSAPLWALGGELAPYLDGLPGPPWELAEAYQRAIDDGHTIAPIEIGRTRDLTNPLDLVRENFPYLDWTAP